MISLISIVTFIGFYLLYCTSKRIAIQNIFGIENRIKNSRVLFRVLGVFILVAACILHVGLLGLGSGVFTFFIVLMTVGSLIVLLAPMRLLTYASLSITLAIALFIEIELF